MVLLDVRDDFMSAFVRKGGSPCHLRARPECHRRTDLVSGFRASESGSSPKDTTRLCLIEVFAYLSPSESTTTVLKFPLLFSRLCELDFEREE